DVYKRQQWASEGFLKVADVDTLTNGYKLPFIADMTCDTGYYIHPKVTIPGLSETNVRRAGNGALAVWAATGWGFADDHDLLNRGLFEAIFRNGERRLGPATLAGKAALWTHYSPPSNRQIEAMKMFVLLGDPASRLQHQVATYLPLILKAR
ncbi:MAG: C25 family cysteine peptidase, partial [Anaerolineae bacterium]|nr:C25 family cysteine peptidase [Anaerolineae bacterium]